MFEFLKEINSALYKHLDDINKNIKLRTSLCETALQIFAESLLKSINEKEKVVIKKKSSLGDFLVNDGFCDILKRKYKYSSDMLDNLNIINNWGNDHKHENRSEFIENELRKAYRKVLYCAVNYYNVYYNKNIELNNINQYYDDLLKPDNELIGKLREEIKKTIEDENLDREALIKEQKLNLQIKEQQLENVMNQLNEFNKFKNRIIELENENSEYNNKIDELNIKIAKLEDEKLVLEKNDLLTKLNNNTREIEELRENNSVDPMIDVDKLNKIIYELKEKINLLESQVEYDNDVKNDELFSLQMRYNRKIYFDNSYVSDDTSYVLRNVNLKTTCSSKYRQFYAVLNNMLQRGSVIKPSSFLCSKKLTENELKEVCRIQMMILTLLKGDVLKDSVWRINYINGNKELLNYAILDIFEYISDLTRLAKISFIRPRLELTVDDYADDEVKINIGYNIEYKLDKKYIFFIEDCHRNMILEVLNEDDITNINFWVEDSIKYDIDSGDIKILSKYLELIFGYNTFRPGQFEIISHTLSLRNTIGILPTGSGKSIVYQLSSLLQPKISIIIAPTSPLIKDQCRVLSQRFGITRVSMIISDSGVDKKLELNKLGKIKNIFTFIAPERLQSGEFRSKLLMLKEENAFDKIILDEVHCLSEWGHQFRISYLMVAHTLKQYFPNIKFLGLTATASKNVIKDLMVELNINSRRDIIFNETQKRENLDFEFTKFSSVSDMEYAIKKELLDMNVNLNDAKTNAAVIFMKAIGKIDSLYEKLSSPNCFGDLVGKFYSSNKLSTEKFIDNKESVLIATKAFGMGIDKPNIRLTIHYGVPSSLEAFYQEAGRAGREVGSKAKCKIFTYEYTDYQKDLINEFFDENTSILRLKELTNDLRYQVDIATNFYFLTKDLKDPLEEKKEIVDFCKKIYSNVFNNICTMRCIWTDDNKTLAEKNLYILHKCGIVDNWEIKYNVIDSELEFTIFLDSQYRNIEYIKTKVKNYINQYPDDHEEVIEEIDKVNNYNGLGDIIINMRSWYYNNFILTRRMQLKNIYKYATVEYCGKGMSDKIQNVIDDYFNISNIVGNSKMDDIIYGFDNVSIDNVLKEAISVERESIESSIVQIEREMESVINNKMRIYLALLSLRKDNFDPKVVSDLFNYVLGRVDDWEKENIYIGIRDNVYNKLNGVEKKFLLNILYKQDKLMFKKIILYNLVKDNVNIMYWIPYINDNFE